MLLYYNSQLLHAGTPLFDAANRGFRYGDGLFETIRVYRGEALLWPLHMQRLQAGMATLGITLPADFAGTLARQVLELCGHNACAAAARVRIAVYREAHGGAGWVIEAEPLAAEAFAWNTLGWTVEMYPHVQKHADILANHKTANYLPYLMAARAAQEQGVDECLILNSQGFICDGSRTNVFIVQNGQLITPALSQGCVAGVMRSHLLQFCAHNYITCKEGTLQQEDISEAEEVFLTNAIQGIRWVQRFGNKTYSHAFGRSLYEAALATIYR